MTYEKYKQIEECPHCGSNKLIIANKFRFKCKNCNKSFYKYNEIKKYKKHNAKCIYCNSPVVKTGDSYRCKSCKKSFVIEKSKRLWRYLKRSDVNMIRVFSLNIGLNRRDLCKHFKISPNTFTKIINGQYICREERI